MVETILKSAKAEVGALNKHTDGWSEKTKSRLSDPVSGYAVKLADRRIGTHYRAGCDPSVPSV